MQEKTLYAIMWTIGSQATREEAVKGRMITVHTNPARALDYYHAHWFAHTVNAFNDPTARSRGGRIALKATKIGANQFGSSILADTREIFTSFLREADKAEKTSPTGALEIRRRGSGHEYAFKEPNANLDSAIITGEPVFLLTERMAQQPQPPRAAARRSASNQGRKPHP